ncbi:DUF6656 family protein [Gellertiella hungarica]|uniref:Uncharacterized protein n=1 Tax=Gellertiella hungarica TaxID=1572859 RepID=A0A7W6J5P9_9HYPH|nr:DUF6656 family protein [Gellertiella hungarica]MBB4064386.1 hypothetical protein [Gellertiella hungarica]
MSKLRYFAAEGLREAIKAPATIHSEFLRTGRIFRGRERWDFIEKRYMSYEEVAERTGRVLERAGERTHDRINSVHHSISFPKIVFHRTLDNRPHLGYCHVTAAKTELMNKEQLKWSFYIANFFSEIGEELKFVGRLDRRVSRMYFAVAVENDNEVSTKMVVDRKLRPNGILFRTHDPKVALKNVLMLGTNDPRLRQKIRDL